MRKGRKAGSELLFFFSFLPVPPCQVRLSLPPLLSQFPQSCPSRPTAFPEGRACVCSPVLHGEGMWDETGEHGMVVKFPCQSSPLLLPCLAELHVRCHCRVRVPNAKVSDQVRRWREGPACVKWGGVVVLGRQCRGKLQAVCSPAPKRKRCPRNACMYKIFQWSKKCACQLLQSLRGK